MISNYDLVKNDGGGIYTWNGDKELRKNQVIDSNIVVNAFGAVDGTIKKNKGGFGIYLDDCSENIIVKGNTVLNCNGSGIYLHGTNFVRVTNNLSCNNNSQYLMAESTGRDCSNNTIVNNVFFALNNQATTKFMLNKSNFIYWILDRFKVRAASYDSFEETTWDNNIIMSSADLKLPGTEIIKYNPTNRIRFIKLPSSYKNIVDNGTYTLVKLMPYSSCILVKL